MGKELSLALELIVQSLQHNANALRSVAHGKRGDAWRILNAATTSIEASAHTIRSLTVPVDEEICRDVALAAIPADDLAARVDVI